MTNDEFWALIEQSRGANFDCQAEADRLTELLLALPPAQLIEFDRYMTKRLNEAYRHDLWAVAYIIGGGCSDDGFEYFRRWLVSRGRAHFETALISPERAADGVVPGEEAECEDIRYAVDQAYRRITGRDLPPTDIPHPSEPAGTPWSEDDIEELYPRLWERFL